MKKTTLLFYFINLLSFIIAQTPQAFKYQAVARDTTGNVLSNTPVAIRIWILQGSPTGPTLYRERHTATTNEFGLVNLEIGRGTPQIGIFSNINWAAGPMFLKVELDPEGLYGYYFMGTSELLSVPYALYARGSSGTNSLADADGDTKVQVEKNPDEDIIRFDLGGTETMALYSKRLDLSNSGNNVLFGKNAGLMNTTGYSNVAIGNGTLYNSSNQSELVAVGDLALYANGIGAVGVEGTKNTAVGSKALSSNNKGYWCSALGYKSLYSNTTGISNTAVGFQSLMSNNEGTENTAVGKESMYSTTTGFMNTSIGYQSLYLNTTGYHNTAVGSNALYKNISGDFNVAIGNGAGYWETENNRLYIDNQNRSSLQDGRENALIYGVFGSNPGEQQLTINGNVGIKSTNPTVALEVNGHIKSSLGFETSGSITAEESLTVHGWTTTEVLQITGSQGFDIAENFEISELDELPAGSVVVIDENIPGALKLSTKAYDPLVAGILSGAGGLDAGVTLGKLDSENLSQKVALSGRVYVLATTENGAIKPGDRLTTSCTPGHAMKATDQTLCDGAVIGKAMSMLEEGEGLVLVLVNLQ